MRATMARTATVSLVTGALLAGAQTTVAAGDRAEPGPSPGLTASVIASGATLSHMPEGMSTAQHLTGPDDIALMDGRLFVGFQNGVGAQGEPSATGNLDSTIVELTTEGRLVDQWPIRGKCDGLVVDPWHNRLIATVNEDGSSSLYTIAPGHGRGTAQVEHYQYDPTVLPHNGGTDSIAIVDGEILISASAPAATGDPAPQPGYPAVYRASLNADDHVASLEPLFGDEATARLANVDSPQYGQTVTLGLTDPDSSAVVPAQSPRFAGSFVLDSQGDQEQVYVRDIRGSSPTLWVLQLSQSINDTAWATSAEGTLYATDSAHDAVDAVHGRFRPGTALVAATPCGANSAPSNCPAPPAYPANYLGWLNLATGAVSPVSLDGASVQPGGLVFAPGAGDQPRQ